MAVAAPRARARALTSPSPRAVATPAPAREPAVRPRRRPEARPRLGRSVVWIGVVATLLAGIVALNVAVLQLRVARGTVSSEIAKIRAENAELQAELSSAAAVGRTQALGSRLGLVEPSSTVYVQLKPKAKAKRAATR